MIMLAFTNNKALNNVYSKKKGRFTDVRYNQVKPLIKEGRTLLKNIKKLIALHIVCGSDDEFIRESYGLTKMQLAGHKRNVTHKKLKGELTTYLSDIELK